MSAIATILAHSRRRAKSAVYRAAVMADAPLAYWRMREVNGAVAIDETGNFHGSYIGTPSFQSSGPMDIATRFPSGSVYMEQTSGSLYPGSSDFTLEGWFRSHVALTSSQRFWLAGKYNSSSVNNRSFGIQLQNENVDRNYWRAFISADGTSANTTIIGQSTGNGVPESVRASDAWHHWVLVRSGSTMRLYIDGVEIATNTISGALFNTPEPFRVNGMATSGIQAGDCYATEVAIYHSALSAARVSAHYAAAGY